MSELRTDQRTARSGIDGLRVDRPVVLERRSKGKKRRYSKGLREVQELEASLSRGARRAARAAQMGTGTYERARRRSARKRRDGAIRDFVPNMGEGLSESLREASKIPSEVADSFDTKSTRRLTRRRIEDVSRSLRAWRV
jgi:hypothetical protein